ncbi:unnamed protein product [marine sediment metagenome]|uniref:Uncharacterized protein n=1 Tax=marine sediment metagenome TaxID=412755 RepID=X1TJR0_9ZZZZ
MHDLSFVHDPTRVFRAVRFEQRFGFKIVGPTEKLIKETVAMNLFDKLSDYRISSELRLILQERDPLPALKRLEELGVLGLIRRKGGRNKGVKRLLDKIDNMSSDQYSHVN